VDNPKYIFYSTVEDANGMGESTSKTLPSVVKASSQLRDGVIAAMADLTVVFVHIKWQNIITSFSSTLPSEVNKTSGISVGDVLNLRDKRMLREPTNEDNTRTGGREKVCSTTLVSGPLFLLVERYTALPRLSFRHTPPN